MKTSPKDVDRRRRWRKWYARNREKELARYRERYASIPEFRERGKVRARVSEIKKRCTRIVQHPLNLQMTSEFIGIPSSEMLRLEKAGCIPKVSGKNKSRIYTPRQVLALLFAVQNASVKTSHGEAPTLDDEKFTSCIERFWEENENDEDP